jgi:cytochrome c
MRIGPSFSFLLAGHVLAAAVAVLPQAIGAAELRGHGGPVRTIVTDGASSVLTGSFDTRAIRWDLESGEARHVMHLHEGSVTALALLPDGRVATAGQEGRIALWRDGEREPDMVLAIHHGPVTALALAPDGTQLASASWDGRVVLTPLGDGAPEEIVALDENVNGIGFLPEGGLVAADYAGILRFWQADGSGAGEVTTAAPVNALGIDGAGFVWAAAADGVVRVLDPGGAPIGEIAVGPAPLVSLAIHEHRVAVGAIDGSIAVIDAPSMTVELRIAAAGGPVWAVAFAQGGEILLAPGADNVVRGWETATGAPLAGEEERLAEMDDGSRGAEVFRMCAACHTLEPDDGNRAGPSLYGIFGRPIASAEGFRYSEALRGMDIIWTPETVARLFEIGPMAMTPGTSMPEQRIPDPEDRAALIAFLERHTR